MNGFWQFANEHWGITIFALYLAFRIAQCPFVILNRIIRHRNIVARGWPENPLMDADGDIVHPSAEE